MSRALLTSCNPSGKEGPGFSQSGLSKTYIRHATVRNAQVTGCPRHQVAVVLQLELRFTTNPMDLQVSSVFLVVEPSKIISLI